MKEIWKELFLHYFAEIQMADLQEPKPTCYQLSHAGSLTRFEILFFSLSDSYLDLSQNQADLVVETSKMVQDVLVGYKDLCEHIFSVKTMGADHKKAAEKMSNIKKKVRIQGSYLGENTDECQRLERHLEKNHFEISDLETRRAFSLLVLAQETKMVVTITELLGVSLQELANVQIAGMEKCLVNYRQIKESGKDLRNKTMLIK